jgi:hypothetical protein
VVREEFAARRGTSDAKLDAVGGCKIADATKISAGLKVVVILNNACGAGCTYRIDGSVVTQLGFGDLHDSHYDHMERAASFVDLLRIEDGSEAGLNLNQDQCPYTIFVYP